MTSEEFNKLYMLDCSEHIEKKDTGNGRSLSYLSWSYAWAHFKSVHPDATYEVERFDNLPYVADPVLGIMVYTSVTVNGLTHQMWLPVMDPSNRAMKLEPYSYKVWNGQKRTYEDKFVKAADMMDINKTIMRCLTKNLAMFGLGLSIYAGEDIPQPLTDLEEGAIEAEMKARKEQAGQEAAAKRNSPSRARKQPQDTGDAQEEKRKQRLTMEMFNAGKLQQVVDWLVNRYDRQAAAIPEAAFTQIRNSYDWEDQAFVKVVDAANRQAFSNDLNS